MPGSSSDSVTITLPAHPLRNRPLPLVRLVRAQEGDSYAAVEHPDGGPFRVPLEWTDRAPPTAMPQIEGRDVRLSADGLRRMAAAVRADDPTHVGGKTGGDWRTGGRHAPGTR